MTQQLYGVIINGAIDHELYYDDQEPRASNVLPIVVETVSFDPTYQTLSVQDTIGATQITRQQVATSFTGSALTTALAAALAAHRYTVQNGGVTINSKVFRTDTASQFALTGALLAAQAAAAANTVYSVDWKVADGTFVNLTGAQVISAWQTGAAFVQKCFESEKSVIANVANYSTPAAIIAAFDTAMSS